MILWSAVTQTKCSILTASGAVTIAAGVLQKAGFIDYRRGEVEIINRGKLEETSCECYETIKQQIEKWQRESPPVRTVRNVPAPSIVPTVVPIKAYVSACCLSQIFPNLSD